MSIEFDNNSAHVTPMCKKCVNSKTEEDLEAIYVADLEEFDREEKIQPSGNDTIWDQVYFARIPKKIAIGDKHDEYPKCKSEQFRLLKIRAR